MAKKLQILRGTTAQNDAYTGSIGELTMDTEKVEVRIHDGTTQGGKTIGSGGGASLPILMSMWSDHLLNDVSWLRADTFSWQSGDVYVAAYEHLVEDAEVISYIESITMIYYRTPSDDVVINGTQYYAWTSNYNSVLLTTSATPQSGDTAYNQDGTGSYGGVDRVGTYIKGAQTETIGDITIKYYLAEDGHKICLPDQESNLVALYEATGVAWYYILDTANKQFKLPRTKFGFTGVRSGVGGYVAPGLPNITGEVEVYWETSTTPSGAFYKTSNKNSEKNNASGNPNLGFDASRSNSIYGNSDTVQPPATQMYLYFYVGNFEQSAVEQTAGITAETLNGKVDLPTGKAQSDVDFVVESQLPTEANGYTWYRKYKSGWVEQGGRCTVPATNGYSASTVTVTLPVPIAAPEQASLTYNGTASTANFATCEDQAAITTTSVIIGRWNNGQAAAAARYYVWVLVGQAQ